MAQIKNIKIERKNSIYINLKTSSEPDCHFSTSKSMKRNYGGNKNYFFCFRAHELYLNLFTRFSDFSRDLTFKKHDIRVN